MLLFPSEEERSYRAFLSTFIDPKSESLLFDMRPKGRTLSSFLKALPEGETVAKLRLAGGGEIPLSEKLLTRHVYVQGSIGSGKTTLLKWLLSDIFERRKPGEKVVVFDPKGDYLALAKQEGVPYIIVSENYAMNPVRWNVFREILGGEKPVIPKTNMLLRKVERRTSATFYDFTRLNKELYARLKNIATRIIWTRADMVRGSADDVYFTHNAPASVFQGLLSCCIIEAALIERGEGGFLLPSYGVRGLSDLSNEVVAKLAQENGKVLHEFLSFYRASEAAEHINPSGSPGQAQGVLSLFRMYTSDVFSLVFSERGNWSMAEELHDPNFKVVFFEYRMDEERTALPVFSAVISNMMAEVLSTRFRGKKLYVFLDELHAFPKVQEMQTFLNMTRDLGGIVVAATQSVAQLYDKYGEQEAKAIISAFNTRVFLRTTDEASLKLVNDTIGELLVRRMNKTHGKEGKSFSVQTERKTLTARTMSVLSVGSGILWTTGTHPLFIKLADFKREHNKSMYADRAFKDRGPEGLHR